MEPLKDEGQIQMLVYAYMGDTVYDLFVRERLIHQHPLETAHGMHRRAVALVRCGAQARTLAAIDSRLSEDEKDIVRRGRNAKSPSVPKNADVREYRLATGFEALLGYLYLHGRQERLQEILQFCEELGWREEQHG
ncbi:MAG: ribonuclease III [Clostridiales bacterium]|nr:ribonuclease III [Clostridiales bacterium]